MKDLKHISKFLSLVLRHKPEEIGIKMDVNGWVNVDELIEKCNARKQKLDFETLEEVVITNDKQRFAFNDEYTMIRANQGHTVNVDLQFEATQPLEYLYHGTVAKFVDEIKVNGLKRMQRLHVHLSKDLDTAIKVGSRRGKPVILKVHASKMYNDGLPFYLSKNGVWLCDEVPAKYIEF
ncbi:MAG: RNA 2'-phosphotransferase [Bacteroidia bacterium]|nr:RNA 2'-phosphotransferase [Bacteroidia bacterium]